MKHLNNQSSFTSNVLRAGVVTVAGLMSVGCQVEEQATGNKAAVEAALNPDSVDNREAGVKELFLKKGITLNVKRYEFGSEELNQLVLDEKEKYQTIEGPVGRFTFLGSIQFNAKTGTAEVIYYAPECHVVSEDEEDGPQGFTLAKRDFFMATEGKDGPFKFMVSDIATLNSYYTARNFDEISPQKASTSMRGWMLKAGFTGGMHTSSFDVRPADGDVEVK